MSNENISVIIQCWHGQQSDVLQARIVRVDTADNVRVKDGTFLLRISTDVDTATERCYIRHIASGREAYVQGGPNLRAFVMACVLNIDAGGKAGQADP
jgi:hypothetical protein